MAKRVQHVRHATAAADAFTGNEGEITADTTTGEVRLHDGSTAGGKRILNKTQNDALYQPLAAVLTNTTASFLTADETKLDGIETAADVTDATNVAAALNDSLASLSALGTAADKMAYATALDTWAETNLTAGARLLLALTAVAGDTIYSDSADSWAALAKGDDGEFYSLVSGIPAWVAAPSANFAVLSGDKNLADASATQAFTSSGFTPTAAMVIGGVTGDTIFSVGMGDGTTAGCIADNAGISATNWDVQGAGVVIAARHSSGNIHFATIDSFDADGITLDWTKIGSPTGSMSVRILVVA